VPPIDRLKIISSADFESVVNEWGNGYLIPSGKYSACKKCSGGGDKGRDVMGVIDESSGAYDNYQCKHYDHPLAPSDIWIEIGKHIYYSFTGDIKISRAYYFVAPQGIGPLLNQRLENPEELKRECLVNWDKKCKDDIKKGVEISLDGPFKQFIAAFDFSIFKGYDPLRLIEEHKLTSYYAARFGGGLSRRRAEAPKPPDKIGDNEMTYTHQLFDAYSDHKKTAIRDINSLNAHEELKEHFIRQREGFYTADSLRQFSRDNLPIDTDYFEELKKDVHTGVIDVYNKTYQDGYERLQATIIQAKIIQITGNPLENYVLHKDREGICQHLANDKRLIWVKR